MMKFYLLVLVLVLFSMGIFAQINGKILVDNKSFRLFSYYSDYEKNTPIKQEPFRIFKNGKYLESVLTNKKGNLLTNFRTPNTNEDFVIQSINQEIAIFVNRKNEIDESYYLDNNPLSLENCNDGCKGNGFYWIKLYSILGESLNTKRGHYYVDQKANLNLTNLEYIMLCDGKTTAGKTDESGAIYIPNREDYKDLSCKISLNLYKLEFEINFSKDTKKANAEFIRSYGTSEETSFVNYQSKFKNFNKGMPYIQIGWSKGLSPAEIKKQSEDNQKRMESELENNQKDYDKAVAEILKNRNPVTQEECYEGDKKKTFALHSLYTTASSTAFYNAGILKKDEVKEPVKFSIENKTLTAFGISPKEIGVEKPSPWIKFFKSDCPMLVINEEIFIAPNNYSKDDVETEDFELMCQLIENTTDIKPNKEHLLTVKYFLINLLSIPTITGGMFILPLENKN